MSQQPRHIYEFGPFRLDAAERLLMRDGEVVPLQPKVFDLLLAMVERHGRLLEKDELMKLVWLDTFVEEANLANNISLIRKALDEGENGHRYIETVPKRGYRFVSPVRAVDKDGELVGEERHTAQSLTVDEDMAVNGGELAAPLINSSAAPLTSNNRSHKRGLILVSIALGLVIVAVAYATSFIRQKFRDEQPAMRSLWQLTDGTGLQSHPSWSPDGRMIAYSSGRSGNFDIWVQQVDGGNPIQVTKSPAHDWQPDWSPDGTTIVFRSERDEGGLFIIPSLGGTERKVCSFGHNPRWSPDGSRILFFDFPLEIGGELKKAYVMALDGTNPREVQSEFLREFVYQGIGGVAWHPDGQRISVWGDHSKHGRGFWTMPITGGAPFRSEISAEAQKQLKDAAVRLRKFQWAPSLRYLYFEGFSKGVRNLWRMTVDPQTLGWVVGPERLTTDGGLDPNMVLSPDGKKLAYIIRTRSFRTWSLPFDAATGKIKGEKQPVTDEGVNARAFDLSHDGKKLSINARRAGKLERWEKSLEDGQEKALATQDNFFHQAGFWSRDGTRLVSRNNRIISDDSGIFESTIVIYPAGGGDEQVLTSLTKSNDMCWDWSADGQWVLGNVCPMTAGPSVIRLLPLAAAPHAEDQGQVLTTSEEYNMWQTRFSPKERWIAFNAVHKENQTQPSTIYVIPASGGEWTRITEGKYWDDEPRWSPDGKILYFGSNRTGFFNVWGIHFNSDTGKPVGEPFRVTVFQGSDQMPGGFGSSYAIGANRLIVNLLEDSGNIWILDNVDR